jgi:branched-chain amino acid transport system permease protein
MSSAERRLPSRLAKRVRRMRPGTLLGWLAFAGIIAWLVVTNNAFHQYLAGLVIIYAISALGLDWIQGRAGQVSIGNAAFMAIGAYVAATAADAGVPPLLCLVLAAFAGSAVGLVVGLPALRLRGLYLALSTLALQFITFSVAIEYETFTGHDAGFGVQPMAFGDTLLRPGPLTLVILATILGLIILVLRNLYQSGPGRAWLAIRENEVGAGVIGIDTTRWKLLAFVASSALIAFAGSLLAFYNLRVFADSFSLLLALSFVAMVIIGGVGSIPGVILGAVLVTLSPYVLSALTAQLPDDLPITAWLSTNVYYINNGLFGILVMLFLLYQPRGIAGTFQVVVSWASRRGGAASRVAPARRAPAMPATDGRSDATTTAVEIGGPATSGDAPPPLLTVDGLSLTYRTGAVALHNVRLSVGDGEIVALLGRNGAGKTSTLRAISGFFVADKVKIAGRIEFDGLSIRGASPVATSRRGIILVPEREKVFPNLTVGEHLELANPSPETRAVVEDLYPVLESRRKSAAGLLSGGERQMLALAMAWCLNPRLLLLDEVSLGLAPAVVRRLIHSVKELRDRTRVPILLVEQNVAAALEVADRIYVLEAGRIVHAGPAGPGAADAVLQASLGTR